MAAKKPKEDTAALAADEGAVTPRITLGEGGYIGLKSINGRIYEDAHRAFQTPQFYCTIDEMRKSAIIASAISVYKMLLSRVKWYVEPPLGATEEQKARAKFVESLKDDMENSWEDFIADVIEYLPYGFSVQEKVYRRRLTKNGSRYNDGKIGLRKIAPRAQETIEKWDFSADGRELLGVYQSLRRMENAHLYLENKNPEGLIYIPRSKFMLFTADATRGNPQGNSILKGVYHSWCQMTMLKDQELLAISKDAAGIPIIRIPAKYMAADASDEDKAVYQACLKILNDLSEGTSKGIVFPSVINEYTKKDEFHVDLLERKGGNFSSVDTTLRRYQDEILSALAVDILKAGSNSGSFSLEDGDTNVLAIAMSHRLNEMSNVLNTQLIPQVFSLNGWTDTELPKFVPSDISSVSIEEFSKGLQRAASTGTIELDRPVLNKVRKVLGIAPRPDDEPVDFEALTTNVSNSGKGMEVGRDGDGTSKINGNSSGEDRSVTNSENSG